MTLAFIEGFGSPLHWLIVAFICLLIFGRRLPEVGRSLGKGITEFKKGLKDAGEDHSGQPQDPYQQQTSSQQQQQQFAPPQRPPQQYQQQGYQQPSYQQPPQQAGYPQQQMPPPRLPQQPAVAGQSQVRVTRNDMVD